MADLSDKNENKTMDIFMPYAAERIQNFKVKKKKFIHYTSAENATKILNSGQIWMRSPMTMADYSEIDHGHSYLLDFLQTTKRKHSFIMQ